MKRNILKATQFKALLVKDIIREFKTKEMLVSMLVYAFVLLLVFGICLVFLPSDVHRFSVAAALLWALVLFTSLSGLSRSFDGEKEENCFEALLLAPLSRSLIYFSKICANLFYLLAVELIVVPVFMLIFIPQGLIAPVGVTEIFSIAIPLFTGSFGLTILGTFFSTITSRSKGKGFLLAILIIPLSLPLLYVCVSATVAIFTGSLDLSEILFQSCVLGGGFDVIMLVVCWLLYDFVVSA